MPDIRTLEQCSIKAIHNAFSRAFSDYVIPFNPSIQQLEYMLQRRGYASKMSFGAFYDGQLVSFILNCIGQWNGQLTAYDTGTGTVRDHRRQGLSEAAFNAAIPILSAGGVTQFLLEVMIANEGAVNLYLKTGFAATRTFDYYLTPVEKMALSPENGREYTIKETTPNWPLMTSMWDIGPSWQNSPESVMRKQLAMKCLCAFTDSRPVGYAIIEPHTGDVPQLAVSPEHRRTGVATALVRELVKHTHTSTLRFANIDAAYAPFKGFMEVTGQQRGPQQYEMLLKI